MVGCLVLPQELTTDGFEWTSDSDDAIGSTLSFGLAGFFEVTEIQLLFPAGDTYKFDLSVSGGDDSTLITVRERDMREAEIAAFLHVRRCSDDNWAVVSRLLLTTGHVKFYLCLWP